MPDSSLDDLSAFFRGLVSERVVHLPDITLSTSNVTTELWNAGVSAEYWQNKENPNFKSQREHVLSTRVPVMVVV